MGTETSPVAIVFETRARDGGITLDPGSVDPCMIQDGDFIRVGE